MRCSVILSTKLKQLPILCDEENIRDVVFFCVIPHIADLPQLEEMVQSEKSDFNINKLLSCFLVWKLIH